MSFNLCKLESDVICFLHHQNIYFVNFKIFKIPLSIHFSFWLFALLIIGSQQDIRESIIIIIVILLSLLTHEYGHAFMAYHFHAKPTIILYAFGGTTHFDQSNITNKQYFFITLSGTMFQGLLIFIAHMLLKSNYVQQHYYLLYMLTLTKQLNIIWTILTTTTTRNTTGASPARPF